MKKRTAIEHQLQERKNDTLDHKLLAKINMATEDLKLQNEKKRRDINYLKSLKIILRKSTEDPTS